MIRSVFTLCGTVATGGDYPRAVQG